MKEYITNVNTDDIKNILKIQLHTWDVKKNYPKNGKNRICPIAEKKKIQQGMH